MASTNIQWVPIPALTIVGISTKICLYCIPKNWSDNIFLYAAPDLLKVGVDSGHLLVPLQVELLHLPLVDNPPRFLIVQLPRQQNRFKRKPYGTGEDRTTTLPTVTLLQVWMFKITCFNGIVFGDTEFVHSSIHALDRFLVYRYRYCIQVHVEPSEADPDLNVLYQLRRIRIRDLSSYQAPNLD